jgi:hypothetical protein
MKDIPPIIAFCQGGEQACARVVKQLGSEIHLLLDDAEKTAMHYRVSGYPTAVVVDKQQKIRGYGHPGNIDDLRRVVARSLGADSANANVGEEQHLAALSTGASQ